MTELDDACESWQRQPFPPGSSDDAIDELHADLALADSWIAEAVLRLVEHGQLKFARVDVIDELRTLAERAAKVELTASDADGRLLEENLPRRDEPGREVRQLLGPQLTAEARRLERRLSPCTVGSSVD